MPGRCSRLLSRCCADEKVLTRITRLSLAASQSLRTPRDSIAQDLPRLNRFGLTAIQSLEGLPIALIRRVIHRRSDQLLPCLGAFVRVRGGNTHSKT